MEDMFAVFIPTCKAKSVSGVCLPLFWRLGDLFQSATGLFELCQSVGRWKGWHGWVLDERMAWVVATEVGATANATATPRGVSPTGQCLGVQRVGFPWALCAVRRKC